MYSTCEHVLKHAHTCIRAHRVYPGSLCPPPNQACAQVHSPHNFFYRLGTLCRQSRGGGVGPKLWAMAAAVIAARKHVHR